MPRIDGFFYQEVNENKLNGSDTEESHSIDWDLMAELVKNSMDTIKKASLSSGKIVITIDSQNKTVNIELKQ